MWRSFCGVQILFLYATLVYVLKSLDEASLVFFFLATFSNVPLLLAVLSCCQVASWSGPECDVVLGSFSLKPHSETYSSRGSTWTSRAACRGFCLSAETLQSAAIYYSISPSIARLFAPNVTWSTSLGIARVTYIVLWAFRCAYSSSTAS